MHEDSFNRTLDFNKKLKYFLGAWALTEIVLLDAVYKLIQGLQHRNIIHISFDFDPSQVFWGNSVTLNIIKVVLLSVFAVLFGIVYSYLARKVTESDKANLSLLNAVFSVFGTILILLLFVWIASLFSSSGAQIHDTIVEIVQTIRKTQLYSIFIIIQFLAVGIFSYIGFVIGGKLTEGLDEEQSGRLLGIKWYHYLWLWPAISIYSQAFLYLIYLTLHALRVFLSRFKWWELFGATSSSQDAGSQNSFQGLIITLVFLYIVAAIILNIIKLQRDILSGDRKMNILLKVIVSIIVAFIVPILLSIFTIVGSSNA